jgi:hypothetical protein
MTLNTKESKMTKVADRDVFLAKIAEKYGDIDVITRAEVLEVCDELGVKQPAWITMNANIRVGRGEYSLHALKSGDTVASPKTRKTRKEKTAKIATPVPATNGAAVGTVDTSPTMENSASAEMSREVEEVNLVPERAAGYVPFGHFADVRAVIKSKVFYPDFVTGLSGCGKTLMIEQACAVEKRECIRVNITIETDEDDLIGGFRLIDGQTVWQNGPVVIAMQRGAILLLDEVDLGSNKLMCLQPVLEGKAIFLKKVNKTIHPEPGFQIFATANTKGKGSDDGRFIGTNVLNEAFLERFSITMDQDYPAAKTEEKILNNLLASANLENPKWTTRLVTWAGMTRLGFATGELDEIISTRRLVHIVNAYLIFNQNTKKAVELCLNRFDDTTKYSKIADDPDAEILAEEEMVAPQGMVDGDSKKN